MLSGSPVFLVTVLLAALQGMCFQAQRQQKNEIVMSPGMKITASTPTGTVTITAIDRLTRSYTWEGATRTVEMEPRTERWYGSLGLYFPGPGDHWAEHNGITRGVLEEGQQHFQTVKQALDWLQGTPYVYRDDGLVVGWSKVLDRRQLNVEVWQIIIHGKKPTKLPGSQNSKITVTRVQVETSPLVKAIYQNDLKMAEALLGKGANPNVKTSIGIPALVLAAKQGDIALVQALLDKGADPNTRSSEGSTALLKAVDKPAIIHALLAKGANVNAADKDGNTALILAAWMGQAPSVQALLEKGANVNAHGIQGDTALHWAAGQGHLSIVEMLLNKGAEVDARNWFGGTPLMDAAMEGHIDIVKRLIARRANVNAKDDKTRQLYSMALFTGNKAAQEQIEKSGKLKVLHQDGRSVMDWAVIGEHKEIIRLLKQAGAKE